MTVEARNNPAFTPSFEAEDDEVVQYHAVSVLAIVGLLLGLASPLCFMAPLLMMVPVIGAVVSLIALRRISASEGALVGRKAAAAGLALCIAFSVAAVSRAKVTQYLRTQQAESVARQWFELVQSGQTEPAFRLTVRGASPEPPPPPGSPESAPAEDPLAHFLHDPVVEALQAAGEAAIVEPGGSVDYSAQSGGQVFVRRQFVVTPPAGVESGTSFDVTLTLQRARVSGERDLRWLVAAHSSERFPAADEHSHPH